MKIRYGHCKTCQTNLHSFKSHEMAWCLSCNNSAVDIEELYSRTIGNAEVREGEIYDLIEEIREIFTWTSMYDKDMQRINPIDKLLKDLDTDHIINIILHVSEANGNPRTINIMASELKYRHEQKSLGI
jgi:hypothetical protein